MHEVVWIHFALPRTAWYEQADQQRKELEERWREVRTRSRNRGGSSDGQFNVRGQSDYSTVEIWRFPDADAAFDHWVRLTAAGYSQWFQASNSLGAPLLEDA